MTTDSGHFRYANPALLRSFADLMAMSGAEIDEIYTMTDLEPDISERIAVTEGCAATALRTGGRPHRGGLARKRLRELGLQVAAIDGGGRGLCGLPKG